MAGLTKKSFDAPESTVGFPKGVMELVMVGDAEVWRLVFEPGWHFAASMRQIDLDEVCDDPHVILTVSGRLAIRMADGTEKEFGPGEVSVIPAGHDAWVVGDEPFVGFDVQDAVFGKAAA